MKVKLTSIEDAVSRIESGSSVAIGGALLRRQPNAIIREMIRQGHKDLTVYSFATTSATDMLAGAGTLKRFEGVYVGFFWHGLAPNFRRGVETGAVEVRDICESAMLARFRAAAMGLSYFPVKTLLGTDIPRLSPDLAREVSCPFTGQTYHAVAPAKADVAIIHGYVADEFGNVQWPIARDSDDIDQIIARSADRVIVSVERIVSHREVSRLPTLTYIPHIWVDAVVEAPFGAHPTACDSYYNEDEDHLAIYLERARKPHGFASYLDEFVYGVESHDAYLARMGGTEALSRLNVPGDPS